MTERDEMTGAELLREAAQKMRERAEDARWFEDARTGEPLAWSASPHGDVHGLGGDWICDTASASLAEHVASWHPAVALAVADWLDETALMVEIQPIWRGVPPDHATAVASAYLAATEGI